MRAQLKIRKTWPDKKLVRKLILNQFWVRLEWVSPILVWKTWLIMCSVWDLKFYELCTRRPKVPSFLGTPKVCYCYYNCLSFYCKQRTTINWSGCSFLKSHGLKRLQCLALTKCIWIHISGHVQRDVHFLETVSISTLTWVPAQNILCTI